MVFLHKISSRKRPMATAGAAAPAIAHVPPPKTTSSSSTENIINTTTTTTTKRSKASGKERENEDFILIEKMISLLADAGVTLQNPGNPPCLPSDLHKLRRLLDQRFSSDASLLTDFLSGFNSYTRNPENLRRVLISASRDGSSRSESLVRVLLLVSPLQLKLQQMLLEKLPEYFDVDMSCVASLEDDVPRLILNQFRWLDFIVDSEAFTDKLLEVLSISPLQLKKEIIGSLPEIVGDQNNKKLVAALEQMLQEDSAVIVPVLDSFSNLHLDDQLQEQVITISLSCIRTVDAEHMPYLLRFLMLSATPENVRRIISQIREHLKFVGVPDSRSARHKKVNKGKALVDNTEGLILEALRSSLRFKNLLCLEILKELKCLDKAKDHKVIDVWLLMLIYTSGGSLQKSVVKIIKTKVIEDHFKEALFDQCIDGHRELVQDYFPSFLSWCEHLLASKEQIVREYGIHMYTSLFEEFTDNYSRQEILGALVTHVGSGVGYEVSSALDTMVLLASKYAEELLQLSSYINGILDYLEGFNTEKLHKVYEVFSYLVLSARSSADSVGSSIVNELLMILRKQVSNPDLKYKKMGLIGTLKIVSCFGNADNSNCPSSSKKTNFEDALELLKASLDSCKSLPLSLILFYDELTAQLENAPLQPAVMEWIGNHVGAFESMFLSDLKGGQLPVKDSYCGLEGELWMNLDGDLSPVCLNILPLVFSSTHCTSLQVLPANFLLISVIERLTNQGSLGGIDALLGCPFVLPSPKYFGGPGWQSLTGKQKQAVCLSLYYATSWIRELLNAFSTQVAGRVNSTSQATREGIIAKLLKRLRNLVFLESLLNTSLKLYPVNLPELHLFVEHSELSFLNKRNHLQPMEKKNEQKKVCERDSSNNKKKQRKKMKETENSDPNGKLRQPTILDVLRKAGAVTTQEVLNEGSSSLSHKERASQHEEQANETNEPAVVEISAVAKVLNAQRFKFRPFLVDCLSILTFAKNQFSCCADPSAELPLHLYLLQDLHYKLDYLTTPSKQFPLGGLRAPAGLSRMTVSEFVSKIIPLFPSLRKHFDAALSILKEGAETCQEHWSQQCISAGNPDIPDLVVSTSSVAGSVFREILCCFSKILNLPDIQMDKAVLSDLLGAFQPVKVPDGLLSSIQPIPSPGNIDYLYCGAYSFLEDVLDSDLSFSFSITSEVLVTLESIVTSVQTSVDKLLEGKGKHTHIRVVQGALPALKKRLGGSAQKLLMHQQEHENPDNGWRNKGEIIQKILQIYLKNSESTYDQLNELACSILPQVPSGKTKTTQDTLHGFPTLCPATFVVWYRVLHEENLAVLHKLVKEVVLLEKRRADVQLETVKGLLMRLHQSVNVVVSLVNVCRTHEKVTVHAMAVKYGGKFVDSFLKVFYFLQTHFRAHNDTIIQLVKELQKATRTIQTLCSEAKGLKQTTITTKIPATKRSLERFLFQVKALLHNTSNGCSFWMGNLKHKDLSGQVVSSQLYTDGDDNDNEEEPENMEADVENQAASSEGEGEAESSA